MRFTMIGTGYVKLVCGACFADFWYDVDFVNKDASRIEGLERNVIPIFEVGLDALIALNVAAKRRSFIKDTAKCVADANAVFIAFGTLFRQGDGHADLSYVLTTEREVAAALAKPAVIVTKSTVPVAAGDAIERIVAEVAAGKGVIVVSNPEFVREGAAIEDFQRPDRVVGGAEAEEARRIMSEIYPPLSFNRSAPAQFKGRRTAELIKYAANAFLVNKIMHINEIVDLCEAAGADVQEGVKVIGLDNRIGRKPLRTGPGYGGSCFPKDTLAPLETLDDHESPLPIVEAVVALNDYRKRAMGQRSSRPSAETGMARPRRSRVAPLSRIQIVRAAVPQSRSFRPCRMRA